MKNLGQVPLQQLSSSRLRSIRAAWYKVLWVGMIVAVFSCEEPDSPPNADSHVKSWEVVTPNFENTTGSPQEQARLAYVWIKAFGLPPWGQIFTAYTHDRSSPYAAGNRVYVLEKNEDESVSVYQGVYDQWNITKKTSRPIASLHISSWVLVVTEHNNQLDREYGLMYTSSILQDP